MAHLLVTNDFPPKIGGIQSYLWELWRRFPTGSAEVLTTPYAGTAAFDAAAPLPITRTKQKWMAPTRGLREQIVAHAKQMGTDFVLLDPALPMGWLGPQLRSEGVRYGVILHGAEVTVPGRLTLLRTALAKVLADAELVVVAFDLGIFPGDPLIRSHAVVMPAFDHERTRRHQVRQLGIVRDVSHIPLKDLVLVGEDVAVAIFGGGVLHDPFVEVGGAD